MHKKLGFCAPDVQTSVLFSTQLLSQSAEFFIVAAAILILYNKATSSFVVT